MEQIYIFWEEGREFSGISHDSKNKKKLNGYDKYWECKIYVSFRCLL